MAVIISDAVYTELCENDSQKRLLENLKSIHVESVINIPLVSKLEKYLDLGESKSIVLAIERKADFLLIDEMKGRSIA
jgi:predicted nucleic acid-binding protein